MFVIVSESWRGDIPAVNLCRNGEVVNFRGRLLGGVCVQAGIIICGLCVQVAVPASCVGME